jgi:hypothetical protein
MSPIETMCHALRTLAYDIKSHDDVPALCLRDAANMLEELARSNAELRKALEPFAKLCEIWAECEESEQLEVVMHPHTVPDFTVGDLRAAARALEGGRP